MGFIELRAAAQQALDQMLHDGVLMDPEHPRRVAVEDLRAALAEPAQEPQCNPHPKAPHSFMRNASHNEDRYVCECEGWEPYEAGYQAGMEAALAEPVQEPVAWRTFDGEGGYDYRTYEDNEDYAAEWAKRNPRHVGWVEPLYTALRAALAEPVQEPVALDWLHKWANQDDGEPETQWHEGYEAARRVVQIHLTTPPQRKPLTDEEIEKAYREIWRDLPSDFDHTSAGWIEMGIKYAERAHGIGGSDE